MNNLKKAGALWLHKTKTDKPFFTGEIEINGEKMRVFVFKNNMKESDKHPDWNVLIDTEYIEEKHDNGKTKNKHKKQSSNSNAGNRRENHKPETNRNTNEYNNVNETRCDYEVENTQTNGKQDERNSNDYFIEEKPDNGKIGAVYWV